MADKYAVIRTDNLSGTDQRADLLSVRVYDDEDNFIDAENGVIVKIGALEDGEREVYKATLATSEDSLDDCAILAGVEVMYEKEKRNLDEYINEAGKAVRAYIPRNRNFFSETAKGFVLGAAPTVGQTVGIGRNGKLAAGSTGVGKCVAIEQAGRYTYYVIQIVKA
jgi:hypothetical protein